MTEKKARVRKKSGSRIMRALGSFTDWFYRSLSNGMFGRIFTGYTKEDALFRKSIAATAVGKTEKTVRKIRFTVAEQFDNSRILAFWGRAANFLIGCRMRLYGTFFLTFGMYTGLVFAIQKFAFASDISDISYITASVIISLTALPMLMTGRTVAQLLRSSPTGNFIVSGILGIPDEKLPVGDVRFGDSYNIAILAGVALGSVTYVFSPWYVIAALGILAAVAVVMTFPEIGVISAIAVLPFLSFTGKADACLGAIVTLYIISYAIKILRGRRIIRFEITDGVMLAFGLVLLLGGAVSAGGENASSDAWRMFSLLTGCYVAGNLIRTRQWFRRCLYTALASSTLVAMLTVAGYVFDIADTSWISALPFPLPELNIGLFGNGNMLAAYLTFSLILSFAAVIMSRGAKAVCASGASALLMTTALLVTKAASGWVGFGVGIFLFFLIISRKTVIATVFAALLVPTAAAIAPGAVTQRLLSAFNVTSAATYSMIRTWQGTIRMIVSTGFSGVGISGFSSLYPVYAAPGFERSTDSGALWLRLLSDTGIVGLAVFMLIIVLFLQNCFEYLGRPCDGGCKIYAAGALSAVAGLLVLSLFCDIFSDMRMFYLFFGAISLTCAFIRYGRAEIARNADIGVANEYSASVVL